MDFWIFQKLNSKQYIVFSTVRIRILQRQNCIFPFFPTPGPSRPPPTTLVPPRPSGLMPKTWPKIRQNLLDEQSIHRVNFGGFLAALDLVRTGRTDGRTEYSLRVLLASRNTVLEYHWNPKIQYYSTISIYYLISNNPKNLFYLRYDTI